MMLDTALLSTKGSTERFVWHSALSVILQQKLNDKTQLKWAEFSNDRENIRSIMYWVFQIPISDCKMPAKQSFASSTDVTCLASKKQGHKIYTCSVFKVWILADRISSVWELGICVNCLKKGHIAEKCRASPMCKKCTKHHETLLHRHVDYISQRKPVNRKGNVETHVAALSVSLCGSEC